MDLNLLKRFSLTLTLLCCLSSAANAALITTEFSELVANQGTVEIKLSLANGEIFNGFSVYFAEDTFADLAIITSPVDWDSLVFQPDALLGAGVFDSFNTTGLSSGVARVSFTYLGGVPFQPSLQSLAYELYDTEFEVINSGVSSVAAPVVSVPESSSLILLMMGLFALCLHRHVRKTNGIFQSCIH